MKDPEVYFHNNPIANISRDFSKHESFLKVANFRHNRCIVKVAVEDSLVD